MEKVDDPYKPYAVPHEVQHAVPQISVPVKTEKSENDILFILKKIHFWIKFWSIVTIVGIIVSLIVLLAIYQ